MCFFFWPIHTADNNKTHLGLQAICPTFLSNFNQIWISSTDFHKNLQYHISRKSVQYELS